MKSTFCSTILLTLVLLIEFLSPAVTSATDSSPVKLYVDESRSLQLAVQVWKSLSKKDGFFQTRVMASASYDILKQYDVMIIWNQIETFSYSQTELEAIRKFVEDGGGLLLLGDPLIPRYAVNLKPEKVLFKDAEPLPFEDFSMNQIAEMFGVQFSNGSINDTPSFAFRDPLLTGIDTKLLSFEQTLSPLLYTKRNVNRLVSADRKPVVVSLSYGKGRVGICAARGLFMKVGRLFDRKLGTTDHIISVQKEFMVRWLKWLAENSPVRQISPSDYPASIVPEIKLSGGNAEVYCIPPLRPAARDLLVKWELVWNDFSKYTDLPTPLEFIPAAKPEDKLQVYLRAATAGGLAAGTRISVPGAGEESAMISVLGHEVGHKLIGGWSMPTSEAFAEWFAMRALRATGYSELAEDKMKTSYADFIKLDPSHKKVDISVEPTNVELSRAIGSKWTWMMAQLSEKYGDDVISKCIASLHKNNNMRNVVKKFEGNKAVPVTIKDYVIAFSDATGEDLTPWFRSLGTTIE